MQRTQAARDGERATATLEWAGLAAAATVLLAAIGSGVGGEAGALGRAVASRLEAATSGEPWRWRDAREVRRGGGSVAVRVSRDELRMSPFLDERAAVSGRRDRSGERAGVEAQVTARGCLLCASAEWSHGLGPSAGVGSDGPHAGFAADVDVAARLALASAQVDARLERDLGEAGDAFAQGRLRGTVGAEADAAARARIGPGGADLELEAGAMVGAVARAEARAGIDLLGISIRQSARAEGWAGAGIRATAGLQRTPGVTSWRFGWGGALGIGGASEWSGTVDARAVPQRHRRLGSSALAALLRMTFGLPALPAVPLTTEEP